MCEIAGAASSHERRKGTPTSHHRTARCNETAVQLAAATDLGRLHWLCLIFAGACLQPQSFFRKTEI